MLFLRPDERARSTPAEHGLRVILPTGKRYFFPGGDVPLAMALAMVLLAPDELSHPKTHIELGARNADGTFTVAKTVKHGTVNPETSPAPPTTNEWV